MGTPEAERKSYLKHRTKRIAKAVRWRFENPEKHAAYRIANAHKFREATDRWREKNRDHINAYQRERRANNPNFRLRVNLSNRVRCALLGAKSSRTTDLIGCSISELKTHLEALFKPGMTWQNYGYGDDKWHVDHIAPCARFDLSDPNQQKACFHFTNLQPLWQVDNLRKGDR